MCKQINIYMTNVQCLADNKLYNSLYDYVLQYRKNKVDRLRFERDKRLSLGAEALLIKACRDFGVKYKTQCVITGKGTKPCFEKNDFCFNLSHGGEMAMCAAGEIDIGCDIEKISEINLGVAKKFFKKTEYEYITSFKTKTEQQKAFFKIWTLKESYIKCTGLGLGIPLNSFQINIADSTPTISGIENASMYDLHQFIVENEYVAALCVKSDSGALKIRHIECDIGDFVDWHL